MNKSYPIRSISTFEMNMVWNLVMPDQKLDAVAAEKRVADALNVPIGQPLIRMYIIA